MFPDFKSKISELALYSRVKRYILIVADAYRDGKIPSQEELDIIKKEGNWFYIKDSSKSVNELSIEIERNFLSLISVLELTEDTSIMMFYSKLDFINKKNQQESQSYKN